MLNTSLLEDDNYKDSVWNVSSLYAAPHVFLHLFTVAIFLMNTQQFFHLRV